MELDDLAKTCTWASSSGSPPPTTACAPGSHHPSLPICSDEAELSVAGRRLHQISLSSTNHRQASTMCSSEDNSSQHSDDEQEKIANPFRPASENRAGTPANPANLLRFSGVPTEWSEGFSRLDLERPHPDYSGTAWRNLILDGEAFLQGEWARQAHVLGWDTIALWGVHRVKPFSRFDAAGLVPMIHGHRILAMTDREVTLLGATGSRTRYFRNPTHPDAVPLWSLPR